MSQALLAIQNILQNSNIFNRSRETILFMPFGDEKVTQFSGFLPTSVSHLKDAHSSLCVLGVLGNSWEIPQMILNCGANKTSA